MHPSLADDWRAHFIVRTWSYGMASACFFGLLALRQRLWVVIAAQCFLLASGALCLLAIRATGRLTLFTHLSLALVTPYLAFTGLLQNPANPMTPVFLVLVPLLAGFQLSKRALWVWMWVAMIFGGVAEWMIANGYHLSGPPRPHHGVVAALNLAALVVLVVSFVRWFDSVRRDMLDRLEAASRARTIFLANVSHEIRTPMNAVLGLTELILGGQLEAQQREKIELVHRSGQSLVTLIDDLLLITRAESGRLVISAAPCAVAKVVADVAELFGPVISQKGLTLTTSVAADVPAWVSLDGVRWRQVLTNLVSNAIKFTERGTVHIALTRTSDRLALAVRDDGPGIEPAVLSRLFQPFEQGDPSTTRRFGGSGLGLALSRQLVVAMGGTLAVDSRVGAGACFTMTVPLLEAQVAAGASHTPASGLAAARKPVLVVDDNPINLLVARGLVERAGYEVHVAHNGREAVEAVAQHDFALVLMDCQMPEMDGLEATRRIRAAPQHSQTLIVALTASGLPEELDACRKAGMNDCLVKPVSLAMVKRALELVR